MLSQDVAHPCPDALSDTDPGAEARHSAPGSLPLVRLHEVLDDVAATYAWYTRLFPRKTWATRQPDPIAACQDLYETWEQLDCMARAIEEAKRHVSLLFDLSSQEAAKRRGQPW